jgi:hypothetical protein
MQNFGRIAPRECKIVFWPIHVIACNKRAAFVQGSEATPHSIAPHKRKNGLLRFTRNDG